MKQKPLEQYYNLGTAAIRLMLEARDNERGRARSRRGIRTGRLKELGFMRPVGLGWHELTPEGRKAIDDYVARRVPRMAPGDD